MAFAVSTILAAASTGDEGAAAPTDEPDGPVLAAAAGTGSLAR